MKHNFFNKLTFFALFSIVLASCIKNEVTELGDAGKTRIKIAEAPENTLFLDAFTGIQPVSLFSVRRDANSQGELNKAATVTIKVDPAAIGRYNAAHTTTFELLPDSLYTLGAGINAAGNGTYTFDFAPGEFSKDFIINLNGSKWDLAHKYAFPVNISNAGGYEVSSRMDTAISLVSLKNQYDGMYTVVSGTVTRYTSPGVPANDALSGPLAGNPDVALITGGANTLLIPPPGDGSIQWAAGNNSYVAGINGLSLTVDPATNQVTVRSTQNATLTNWAGKPNYYDPATRTFYLAFRWNPAGATREYEVVLRYHEPR